MRRAGGAVLVAAAVALLSARPAQCDEPPLVQAPLVPLAPSAYGSVFTTFQANTPLIRPSGDRQHRYPFYQYMDLSVASPEQHLSINTFLRARAVGNGDEASFDVYNAQIDYRRPDQMVQEVRLGRQILTEGVNYTLMDGALGRVRPMDGVDLVAYAGRNEEELQPKPDHPGDSYTIFGAKIRTSRLL